MTRLLILNEHGAFAPCLEQELRQSGHAVAVCHELWELFESLSEESFDTVLLATESETRARAIAAFVEGAGLSLPLAWAGAPQELHTVPYLPGAAPIATASAAP